MVHCERAAVASSCIQQKPRFRSEKSAADVKPFKDLAKRRRFSTGSFWIQELATATLSAGLEPIISAERIKKYGFAFRGKQVLIENGR